ncbi:hypothetical protein [Acetobacter fallax]|uniref:Uncharacterized protein n=1 Tax=Acetobacter fallax TaxID=1737473 RepID=A0ABX0K7G9_9PROT|nr:hypothetical protein [Acetobacter fallax]NHO32191.1 hypothetical protein [Acetobacter fallax]NHO35756.1 hypothetical protein [Acetobacter fallax]
MKKTRITASGAKRRTEYCPSGKRAAGETKKNTGQRVRDTSACLAMFSVAMRFSEIPENYWPAPASNARSPAE